MQEASGKPRLTMTASSPTADRIALTLPAGRRPAQRRDARTGGIGSRLDLPYERVDDLQLAVLERLAASDLERATIEVEIDDDGIAVSLGRWGDGGRATGLVQGSRAARRR